MAGKLLFFVDDDKMILNLMEYTFRSRDGYDVQTFFSGEDCIDNLNLNPDIIVLDHIFNHKEDSMSGLETLKKIMKSHEKISVIILSGQEDRNLIPKFIENGAKRYIPKDNFFIDNLIEAIEQEVA
jgi:DNA-binding NarL/FixJ family response regulator